MQKLVNSSNVHIQLNKNDINNKNYLFSVLELLEKNDISFTLIEFDKILSTADIEQINNISKSANIDFRYVYPNFWGGKNIGTEMSVNSYLKSLEKIKYLTNTAQLNFSKKEEQIVFIASQLAKYVNYDIEHNNKSEEEHIKLSSLQNCLDERNTICAGVAFAFERCMTELGIENILVLGYSGNGNIPSSEENFPFILELFNKVNTSNNILEEFDNKKRSSFLKYNINNNPTFSNKENKTTDINIEEER